MRTGTRLTETAISRMPSSGKDVRIFDSGVRNLVLRISKAGTKSFAVAHYVNGKAKYHSLGRFPEITLEAARREAHKFNGNPTSALKEANAKSFKQVTEDYWARVIDPTPMAPKTKSEYARMRDQHLYPRWANLKVEEIKRDHFAALDDSFKTHKRTALAVRQLALQILRWYEDRSSDSDYRAPTFGRSKGAKRKKLPRRCLTDDEIRALWQCTGEELDLYGTMARFALLTGQRRDKCASLRFTDLKQDIWTVHVDHETEKQHLGRVRLPPFLMSVLAHHGRFQNYVHVFPAVGVGNRPFSNFSKAKAALDAAMVEVLPEMRKWRFHDLRHTARTLLSRAGVPYRIAELTIGHALPPIEARYDGHDFFAEKSDALKKLSELVQKILANDPSVRQE